MKQIKVFLLVFLFSFTKLLADDQSKFLEWKKNFRILEKNIVFHSDIAPNRKKDPGEKFFVGKIGIKRFRRKKLKDKYSLDEMLILYGLINVKRFS